MYPWTPIWLLRSKNTIAVLHAFLTPRILNSKYENMKKNDCANLLFEKMEHVLSSKWKDYQITIRKPTAEWKEIESVAMTLVRDGWTMTFRTKGTLRATAMDSPVTAERLNNLQQTLPEGWRIYTDTPINVFAAAQPTVPAHKRVPIVSEAMKTSAVVKLQTDKPSHPKLFENIAAAMGGVVIHVVTPKFSDVAMTAFLKILHPTETMKHMLSAPFSVEAEGFWYATLCNTSKPTTSV